MFCYIYNFEIKNFSMEYFTNPKREQVICTSYRGISADDDLNMLPAPTIGYLILKDFHYWVIVPGDYEVPKLNLTIDGKKY